MITMKYVEGFITPVPNKNKDAFFNAARKAAKVFLEHGALEYVDSWGVEVPRGKRTSFPRAVELRENETVCLSWIVWESKEIRDSGMQKVREDPRMRPDQLEIPFDRIFDHQRMIAGLFEIVAHAKAE